MKHRKLLEVNDRLIYLVDTYDKTSSNGKDALFAPPKEKMRTQAAATRKISTEQALVWSIFNCRRETLH